MSRFFAKTTREPCNYSKISTISSPKNQISAPKFLVQKTHITISIAQQQCPTLIQTKTRPKPISPLYYPPNNNKKPNNLFLSARAKLALPDIITHRPLFNAFRPFFFFVLASQRAANSVLLLTLLYTLLCLKTVWWRSLEICVWNGFWKRLVFGFERSARLRFERVCLVFLSGFLGEIGVIRCWFKVGFFVLLFVKIFLAKKICCVKLKKCPF
jgi:hypothetical protein